MIALKLGSRTPDELTLGRKGDVEVIISGDLGTLDGPVGRVADRMEAAR